MAPNVVSVRIRSSCWLILAIALAACTESSRPSIPTQPGPAGAAPQLTSLTLEGPSSIVPGTTARYTVTARDTDGRTGDVTNEATWGSSANDVATIVSPGVVSGAARGDARVSVQYRHLGSQKDVVVLPDGTYRLIGQVTEAETASVPVNGVKVEAMSGTGEALSTVTGDDGGYRLYGVAGLVRLRFSKDGYRDADTELNVGSHAARNVELSLERPRANVAGSYLLTISAAAGCRDKFPDHLRSRQYGVTLTQSGPLVEARLSGAAFATSRAGRGDHFQGRVEPDGLSFRLTSHVYQYYGYAQYPDLAERVANPTGFIIIDGAAHLREAGSRFEGRLQGAYQFFQWDPAWGGTATIECKGDHEFVLQRTS
jgi:hypothetical protein